MSETAIATIVSGVVTVATMAVGFLTLWVKLKYSDKKAEEAAVKLDANTATTNLVDTKADTIVEQTNGTLDKMRSIVQHTLERVDKLETYNRESSHRLFDVVNQLALKVERLLATQEAKAAIVQPPLSTGDRR